MRPDAIPELMWRCASEYIAHSAGLHFPPERRAELQRGLTSAAAELGFPDTHSCIEWLLEAPACEPRLHTLVSHLTIGDTYFFRERNTFDALAQHVLPELIRRGKRSLRLWSAACSTGEELYSLAILVQQVLPDWREWDVMILGTDINERSLHKAAEGIYGQWSFRNSPPGFRECFFTQTAKGRYSIREEIRQRVRFARLNLAQDNWPALVTGANAMDVILCRKVLMYFSNERANRAAENLLISLTDDGWLAVSRSECSQTRFAPFNTVNFPDCILYRKPKGGAARLPEPDGAAAAAGRPDSEPEGNFSTAARVHIEPEVELSPAAQADILEHGSEPAPAAPVSDTGSARTAQPNHPATLYASFARALANEGKLLEALDATERWIAEDKTHPAAHYLQAMVHQELGHRGAARQCLRHVTYLQPDFVLAHFALGNMALAEARQTEAKRHFTNALELLQRSPPEEPLPESDGTTAAALTEIISALLATPPRGELSEGVSK
jgi:chemotaxis protein methyltransferase CheR